MRDDYFRPKVEVSIDAEADAAYIAFCTPEPNDVARTTETFRVLDAWGSSMGDRGTAVGEILIDLDKEDRIIGIEILGAAKMLPRPWKERRHGLGWWRKSAR